MSVSELAYRAVIGTFFAGIGLFVLYNGNHYVLGPLCILAAFIIYAVES